MKNFVAEGRVLKIEGETTGSSAGDLMIYNNFPGVVVKDIIGTTEQLTTIDGRPIDDEVGSGEGDLLIEGIVKCVDASPSGLTAGVLVSLASTSGVVGDTGSDRYGWTTSDSFVEDSVDYVNVKLPGLPIA